ncbi:MAG: PAS domain S-box protein [Phycisphaerae bacterium]
MFAREVRTRTLRCAGYTSAVVGLAVGLFIAFSYRHHRRVVMAQVRDQNRRTLASVREHVEDYFGRVRMYLRIMSHDPNVRRMDEQSDGFLRTVYEENYKEHALCEVYILRRDFDGTHRPLMTFESGTDDPGKDDLHSPENETEEYAVQIEHIRRFAEDASLKSLVSGGVSLCAGQRGVICSVPVRVRGELAGIVSGMISAETIAVALEGHERDEETVLINPSGEVFAAPTVRPAIRSWFQKRSREQGTEDLLANAGRSFRVHEHARAIWTSVVMPDDARWYLAFVHDDAAHLAAHGFIPAVQGYGLALGVLILGLTLGYSLRALYLRQVAEKALAASERRHRLVVEKANDAFISIDAKGHIVDWNPKAETTFGWSRSEAMGRPLAPMIIPGRFRQAHVRGLAEFLSSGRGSVFRGGLLDISALRRNGEVFPIELSVAAARECDAWQFDAFIRDITERRQTEQEHRRLAQAVAAAAEAIVLTDTRGKILSVNPAFTQITGYTAQEVVGQTPRLLKSGRHPQTFYEDMWRTIERGEVWSNRVIDRRKDGSFYYAALTIAPIFDEVGVVTGFVGVQRDVTADIAREDQLRENNAMMVKLLEREKQVTQELEAARKAAEAATRAKSEFLANMSHEIRTPMTAILGFTDMLIEQGRLEGVAPEQIEAARTIKRNGEYLLSLINDILDLSKIEADKMEVERLGCSPCRIVAEVQSLMRVRAVDKGLTFDVEYEGSIPATISTDPTRVRQVLINLIGNAIKFTKTGGVRLIARFADAPESADNEDAPQAPMMQFDVVDTGIGLTPEQAETLFRPFMQADNSTTRRFGGTGLGLTISKRLTEILGGTVTIVETKVGIGTHFRATVATGPLDGVAMIEVTTDVVTQREETPTKLQTPVQLDCRVLLAEDAPDNQRLIRHVLKKAGADVTIAENGRIAVDKALAARDAGRAFDVILMDMQMPELDGYGATRALRKKGYTGPIIALTAHAMSGDRAKCLQAGCNDYATKPIDRHKLVAAVSRHAGRCSATA